MLKMNEIVTTKTACLWLEDFSAAIRERDYERGLQLFATDVVAFGTYSAVLEGLEALESHQWRHIWDATRNFSFDLENLSCGGDDSFTWIAALWQSEDKTGRALHVFRSFCAVITTTKAACHSRCIPSKSWRSSLKSRLMRPCHLKT